ncbi:MULTISPECIES: hypothetical protein [unclassified Aminobacter]|uniref:hypothetical protein n=1 Tax=unclassified Aminobacter TaxID=2644704 RepID=UPI00046771A3|nr:MULTISPECIES: hypothetical protein [unclassified Aminobacter]TWH35615.1 hypothetical protein L611_001200000960 [Aminobacter sp. J15]
MIIVFYSEEETIVGRACVETDDTWVACELGHKIQREHFANAVDFDVLCEEQPEPPTALINSEPRVPTLFYPL